MNVKGELQRRSLMGALGLVMTFDALMTWEADGRFDTGRHLYFIPGMGIIMFISLILYALAFWYSRTSVFVFGSAFFLRGQFFFMGNSS